MEVVLVSVVELVFALAAAVAAHYAWQHRDRPAGTPVFVLLGGGVLYALSSGVGSLIASDLLTELFALLRWPLGALIAVGVFYTAVEYTGRRWFQQPLVLVSLVGFLVLDAVVIFTNRFHGYALSGFAVEDGLAVYTHGPLLRVHLMLSFLLVVTGLWFLFTKFLSSTLYRRQTATVILGIGIAAGFFVAETVVTIHPAFNIGTVGIVSGSIVLLWAITSARLLETVPIARETLMDNMDAFIIAVDEDNRVIDLNSSAREFLDRDGPVIGQSAVEILGEYSGLVSQFVDETEAEHEFSLQRNGQTRHYSIRISPITHTAGFRWRTDEPAFVGRLIVVTDMTEQRQRERELDLLKEVFARVLRHNMRNDMNVIKGTAELLEERVDEEHTPLVENVSASADDVLDLSEKARDLETVIESPRTKRVIDLTEAVDRAVGTVTEQYPDAEITVDIDRPCHVLTHQQLETALKNLVENACEHQLSPPAQVRISIRECNETAPTVGEVISLTIADNGPGIPEHEVAVIESESETTLQHGSGLGLWIVNWIVNRSDAGIAIATDDGGTTVTLTLDRAGSSDSY